MADPSRLARWRASRSAKNPAARRGHPDLTSPQRTGSSHMIGVVVYSGVTTTEVDQPIVQLADQMDADVAFIARTMAPVTGVEPVRTVVVDESIETAPHLDVLVVPGGLGWRQLVDDPKLMTWLDRVCWSAKGVMAISTGSLILAAAGRLTGREATGHWLARAELASLGANVTTARTAQSEDSLLVTATGAIAALELVDSFADRVRWGR